MQTRNINAGEKLHTIPESYSPASSQLLYTGEDTISPASIKERFPSSDNNQPSRFQNINISNDGTSKITSPQMNVAPSNSAQINQYLQQNGVSTIQSQNPQKVPQQFVESQDSYVLENQKLRLKIEEINEIQQRKRTSSSVLETKQADNILDQYKSLSANYNNAQQRILELEKSLQIKSETLAKQKEAIMNLSRVVQSNMENLGLDVYIRELNLSTSANDVDILTEIANIKILVDSSSAEKHEQEEWMEEQNVIIGSMREEIAQLKIQNQDSVDLSEKMNLELKGAVETLNDVQRENSSLQADKEALLDYVEEMKAVQERVLLEKAEQDKYRSIIEDKLSQTIREVEEMRVLVRDLEQRGMEHEREKKTRELQEKHAIQLSTNEIETLKREKDRIEAQLISAISEVTQIKSQMDQVTSKYDKEGKSAEIAIEKMQIREQNLIQTLRHLEEAILKLNREKEISHQINLKMKEFIQNKEVITIIEEIANVSSEQLSIDKEKNQVNVAIFQLEAKMTSSSVKAGNLGAEFEDQKANRRRFDELKESKREYENNQEILLKKARNLDLELSERIELERGKAERLKQLEKVNNHLRNDLSILKNDIDMKEISRKNIESAYNILLTDYKRLSQDPKSFSMSQNSRTKGVDYLPTSTTITMMTASSNSLTNGSRKIQQQSQQGVLPLCSPSENSYRKANISSIPYNVYENYDESLNMTKGSVKSIGSISQNQFATYNRNSNNHNNYQFD